MSTQNVAQFFEQITIDPDLKAELNAEKTTKEERILLSHNVFEP